LETRTFMSVKIRHYLFKNTYIKYTLHTYFYIIHFINVHVGCLPSLYVRNLHICHGQRGHGNRSCEMYGETIMKRLPLDRWDVVDAEEYNSLFPPVADFRAAIGRPTNDVHLGDKKPPFELGTIERELLSCTCGTCIFLAERYLKKKRANDAEMEKLEADISLAELKLKMKRTAVSKENKRAPVSEKKRKKRSAKKCVDVAEENKRAPVAEDKKPSSKKRTAGAKEK
jgi:hypothetical protein